MDDTPNPLARLDALITALNAVVEEPEEIYFKPVPGRPPRPAHVRVFLVGTLRDFDRQPAVPAEALLFDGANLLLRGATEPVRNAPIEARVALAKTKRGESTLVIKGVVRETKRVSGAYQYLVLVKESRHDIVTAAQRLRECLEKKDPLAWERWCADLDDGVDLRGMDLRRAPLAHFDLCCANLAGANLAGADLAGANLSGANLDRARLDGVRVAGADLFRARVGRRYAAVVDASGLMESRSVQFTDNDPDDEEPPTP